MKVWCIPVNFPHPEKEPEQAEAARRFLNTLKGLKGFTMGENGILLLTFTNKSDARMAKWKLEEFCPERLEIIEGVMTDDGKRVDLHRVLKGE